ncbi:hypothetical protein EUGRSUZ_B00746 [Eucalyptus grandis]|uniref:Uncharacterized protein n=2 Tax=Eucalyptus grandis TaxID=71139 RepID=A0ACC3LQ85_EUCGR|nr:hypothetical protein EUGRSUZ_B00746 [Eucalyptus grandis]
MVAVGAPVVGSLPDHCIEYSVYYGKNRVGSFTVAFLETLNYAKPFTGFFKLKTAYHERYFFLTKLRTMIFSSFEVQSLEWLWRICRDDQDEVEGWFLEIGNVDPTWTCDNQ